MAASKGRRWSGSPEVWRSFERDVPPVIGATPTADVTRQHPLTVTRAIAGRQSVETVHRAAKRLSWFFEFANTEYDLSISPMRLLTRALPKVAHATAPLLLDLIEDVCYLST